MLNELIQAHKYGTPEQLFRVLDIIASNNRWAVTDVVNYFFNSLVDKDFVPNASILLLRFVGAVKEVDSKYLTLNSDWGAAVSDSTLFGHRLSNGILTSLIEFCPEVFGPGTVSFNANTNDVVVRASAFPFAYAGFKQLLLDLKVMELRNGDEYDFFVLNNTYKDLFFTAATEVLPARYRKLSLDKLKQLQDIQSLHGQIAEEYVIKYEISRLAGHTFNSPIRRISAFDVGAGFDILSYNSHDSQSYDRYIEVKSYSGSPRFFWSANEVAVARKLGEGYFLYLINREQMYLSDYEPQIIMNPIRLFEGEPPCEIVKDKYQITLLSP